MGKGRGSYHDERSSDVGGNLAINDSKDIRAEKRGVEVPQNQERRQHQINLLLRELEFLGGRSFLRMRERVISFSLFAKEPRLYSQ